MKPRSKITLRCLLLWTMIFGNLFEVTRIYSQSENLRQARRVLRGENVSYMLTNNACSYLWAESGSRNSTPLQGFNVNATEYLEDYVIEVDGKILQRNQAETSIYSDRIVRDYTDINLTEEASLMDSLPVLMIKLTSTKKVPIAFIPLISDVNTPRNFTAHWDEDGRLLFVTRGNMMVSNSDLRSKSWTGIFVYPESDYVNINLGAQRYYVGLTQQGNVLPGKLTSFIDNPVYIFVIVGKDRQEVMDRRKITLDQLNLYMRDKTTKIEGVRKT